MGMLCTHECEEFEMDRSFEPKVATGGVVIGDLYIHKATRCKKCGKEWRGPMNQGRTVKSNVKVPAGSFDDLDPSELPD